MSKSVWFIVDRDEAITGPEWARSMRRRPGAHPSPACANHPAIEFPSSSGLGLMVSLAEVRTGDDVWTHVGICSGSQETAGTWYNTAQPFPYLVKWIAPVATSVALGRTSSLDLFEMLHAAGVDFHQIDPTKSSIAEAHLPQPRWTQVPWQDVARILDEVLQGAVVGGTRQSIRGPASRMGWTDRLGRKLYFVTEQGRSTFKIGSAKQPDPFKSRFANFQYCTPHPIQVLGVGLKRDGDMSLGREEQMVRDVVRRRSGARAAAGEWSTGSVDEAYSVWASEIRRLGYEICHEE